jgi:hypothetical protein
MAAPSRAQRVGILVMDFMWVLSGCVVRQCLAADLQDDGFD